MTLKDAGGHGDGYGVQLEALSAIAANSGDLGAKVVPMARDAAPEAAAAVRAHSDLAIAAALKETQLTCEKNIEGFGRWMNDLQDRLDAAIKHYRKTDQWSKDLINGIGV